MNTLKQKVIVVIHAEKNLFIIDRLVDTFLQKLFEIYSWNDDHIFQPIDEGIIIGYIYSIAESLFLVLVFIKHFRNIDSIVFILIERVILQFGAMTKPLVNFTEICKII